MICTKCNRRGEEKLASLLEFRDDFRNICRSYDGGGKIPPVILSIHRQLDRRIQQYSATSQPATELDEIRKRVANSE